MRIGIALRTMGDAASNELLATGAARAESLGLDSLWVVDHIAIPPDDAEGSGGLYLDPLSTLGWLAGQTKRIMDPCCGDRGWSCGPANRCNGTSADCECCIRAHLPAE